MELRPIVRSPSGSRGIGGGHWLKRELTADMACTAASKGLSCTVPLSLLLSSSTITAWSLYDYCLVPLRLLYCTNVFAGQ